MEVGPIVLSNGNIAIGSNDSTTGFHLILLAPNGDRVWDRYYGRFGNWITALPDAGIVIQDFDEAVDYGLTIVDGAGSQRWTLRGAAINYGRPSVSDDGRIFTGDNQGNLIGLDSSGSELWRNQLSAPQPGGIGARILFDGSLRSTIGNELVYLCQDGAVTRRFGPISSSCPYCQYVDLPGGGYLLGEGVSVSRYDSSGVRLWQVSATTQGVRHFRNVILGNDGRIIAMFGQELDVIRPDGTIEWKLDVGTPFPDPPYPALVGVVAGASGGVYVKYKYDDDPDFPTSVVHAFDANGVEQWNTGFSYDNRGPSVGILMSPDGTLYYATSNALRAIQTCEFSPARSINPMIGGDAGMTGNETHVSQLTSRYLPASASTDGANGTHWRTDVVLTNPSASDGFAQLAFFPSGQANTCPMKVGPFRIPAAGAKRFDDVVASQFGTTGSGAIAVLELSGPMRVASRTYTTSSAGSYGQFIPPIEDGAALGAGEAAILPWLVQNAGYRTNIGFFNASASKATVDVVVKGADGSTIASKVYEVPEFGHVQVGDALGSGTFDLAWATVSSRTSGSRLYCYASIVDNNTGDAVLVPGQR